MQQSPFLLKSGHGYKLMNNKYYRQLYICAALFISGIGVSSATPTLYSVTALFDEPQTSYGCPDNTGCTRFEGTFKWDPITETISELQGTLNETMYSPTEFPDLHLTYQLDQQVNGNIVTATVFKENTTDVFNGGGFAPGSFYYYGAFDGNTVNENAYFTLAFDKTNMQGVVDELVYADCTPGGYMGPLCMTGHSVNKIGYAGSMDGVPASITITAVPVPAAFWMLGSSLLALLGFGRRTVKAA